MRIIETIFPVIPYLLVFVLGVMLGGWIIIRKFE